MLRFIAEIPSLNTFKEYNQSNTQHLFVYHSYMFLLLQRSHHQSVHHNFKKKIIYTKTFEGKISEIGKLFHIYRYICLYKSGKVKYDVKKCVVLE